MHSCFAFMLTWMREIVKDMEDLKGDEREGCATMPVKRGLEFSTRFTVLLSMLAVIPLSIAAYLLFAHHDAWLPVYIVAMLVAPIIIWSFMLGKNSTKRHYHKASVQLK